MNSDLVAAVSEGQAILFVGAGVSQNLGLPSFSELVNHIGQELGYAPDIFAAQGDYLSLCEYYTLEKGSIGELQSWMNRTWHEGVEIADSRIHQLIVDLEFPLIYTTNYDSWLERAFDSKSKKYAKIANVAHLSRVEPGVPQIVKFHGDFEDDDSIVLTESQYFSRLDFESPLDVKLRADLLGKSVVFIGYSLADINIRYMLYKLNRQWETSGRASSMPASFVFLTRPNAIQERVLESRGVHAIVADTDEPGGALEKFLQDLLNAKREHSH
jgi:NAD-dependent SIR2 family protein deacetylase